MIVETVTFRLVPGTDETAFLDADQRVQTEFYYRRPGLLRRTTARGEDGEWLVQSLWRSEKDATSAMEAARARDDPAAGAYMALIDGPSLTVKRYTALE